MQLEQLHDGWKVYKSFRASSAPLVSGKSCEFQQDDEETSPDA